MEAALKTIETNVIRLKIDNTDIFLEELGEGQGKITISDTYGHNYSNYWGSMGGTLKEFLCRINADYFANKLLGKSSMYEMDVKRTFTAVRKYIREEIGLKWYQHLEFQKHMREELKSFENDCVSQEQFVNNFFSSFVDRLYFYSIEDRYKRESLEKYFKGISEHWHFIHSKESREYFWITKLHKQLKRKLEKEEKK
jgi:hypothetical protein